MGFFDRPVPEPLPEPPVPSRRPWEKPELMLGCPVPEERLLARSTAAAVAVTGLRAYPNGFEFTVTAVLRAPDRAAGPHDAAGWHGPRQFDRPPPPEFLRFGIRFAGGGVATNLDRPSLPGPDALSDGPFLLMARGDSDAGRSDLTYWVWPLPPPGPVTFVCAWPAQQIPESYAEIDAGAVLASAARATPLWPDEVGPDEGGPA